MRLLTIFTVLCAVALLGCSTTGETHAKKTRYSRDHISYEEIQNNDASNAFDLIRNLRPQWLWGRGPKSINYEGAPYPVVYVDDSKHGDINSLSTISTQYITEIRFLSAGDATIRYGINHAGGAILIII